MILRLLRLAALPLLLVTTDAPSLLAQDPGQPDPINAMPIRLGPVGIATSFNVTDIGIDENVRNEAADPVSDFTATLVPSLVAKMRLGRLLWTYTGNTSYVYFHELEQERSFNTSNELRVDIWLGRLQPFASVSRDETRARMNGEVDLRAPRRLRNVTAGGRLLVGTRLAFSGQYARAAQAFPQQTLFEGVDLSQVLNSDTESIQGSLFMSMTALTTASLTGGVQFDRFENSPDRNADSFRIATRFDFSQESIIPGGLQVGYRRFTPLDKTLSGYSGLVLQGNIRFTLAGRARVVTEAFRDVQYSFEPDEPYYVSSRGRLVITYQLFGPFDAEVVGSREYLGYRSRDAESSRTDTIDVLGGAFGYRPRDNFRIGLNVEFSNRDSARDRRRYDKRRIFGSVTYGASR